MKLKVFFFNLLLATSLAGCAFISGVKNKKNVTPVPSNVEAPNETNQSAGVSNQINKANVNAAKMVSL